jgi:hypothetical protein
MILNSTHRNALASITRSIGGKVELYNGSTLQNTFNYTDALSSLTISRVGSNTKFFGFGICQKAEVKLIDTQRVLDFNTSQNLKVSFITNKSTVSPTPRFYISEVKRDENTNELTIWAYDVIYKAQNHTVSELNLEAPYTIGDVVSKIVGLLGVSFNYNVKTREAFNTEYPEGANFEGTETLREVLDAIAEATQTIYYVNNSNALTFRHLDIEGDPVLTIGKANYFTLDSKTDRRLVTIVRATELGDNVSVSLAESGTTQYVRNNPFWDLREDITTLLNNAIAVVGGLTLNQFNCNWRGNYLLEPGDKIALVAKDDSTVISYVLDDNYTYNGGLNADMSWSYQDNDEESVDNPVTLGDALKKTFAKVDKVNKEIELVVSSAEANNAAISQIQMNTEQIATSVSKSVNELTDKVNATITSEQVELLVQEELADGVEKVVTTTGFKFDEEGLTVSKSGTEISTQITEDGMTVSKNDSEVLIANNRGVTATDLHAKTYLIVGTHSRFEDYNDNRTGCFWIGG